jgi:glutamate 5-kinase
MKKRFKPGALTRVVVKIGSSSIISENGEVRLGFLGDLVTTVGRKMKDGLQVVLVSSGAIAMGSQHLGMVERPVHIQDKQACAAAGQTELMALYQSLFSTMSLRTGQVLLTREDLENRRRYLNGRETLLRLLELSVIPIINENDSVSVDEIKFGDNDELSAMVAGLVDADLLIMLTDVDGIHKTDPRKSPDAPVIPTINGSFEELAKAAGEGGEMGQGGMNTKLEAARICSNLGIPCIIARGDGPVLVQALDGEPVGSYVIPGPKKVLSRGRWVAQAASVQGTLVLDKGAVKAIRSGKASLLPPGIAGVEGEFLRGAVVVLADQLGKELGRGVVRYASADLQRILGKHGDQIEPILGFTFGDEIVHRNNIVLTA